MKILLEKQNELPIYEQIKQQIKGQVLQGELAPGMVLPSMRELARQLDISLITTKRAYEDLEKEGYLCTYRGKGTYVNTFNTERLKETQLKMIEEMSQNLVKEAKTVHMPLEALTEMIKKLYME